MAHIEANARLSASVIRQYLRKVVSPIYKKSILMGMIQSRGRVSFNNHGELLEWRPRIRRRTITAGEGNPSNLSFPATNVRIKAEIPWRTYWMGESFSKFERLASQNSETAIFKIVEGLLDEMAEDFIEDFRLKLYGDGGATGSLDIHGIESFMSVVADTPVTNSVAGNPNDSYGGHNTALGTFDDDWTADTGNGWPTGTGDVAYHAWSPLVCDYRNAALSDTSTSTRWVHQWQEAMNWTMQYLSVLQNGKPDICILNVELLRKAQDSLVSTERLQISPRAELRDLGIRALHFNGVDMVTEYGVPAGVGYFLDFDKIELRSMQKELLDVDDDKDITTQQMLKSVDFYGNVMWDAPSYFAKLQPVSAIST